MTSGTLTEGTHGTGYYRKRVWSGQDWPLEGEHAYNYDIREHLLTALLYKPSAGYPVWLSGTMNTFRPSLLQEATDRTIPLINCASAKIYSELAQSNFNAGVFSGEFKETYRMITSTVHSIAYAVSLAKRGKWAKALRIFSLTPHGDGAGRLANAWMMFHFGIMPALNDIRSGLEFMMTHYKVLKRVRRHCVYKDNKFITYPYGGIIWQWHKKAIVEIRGEVEMIELSTYDRLGLTDLAGVAWELTKLSWMVDWLIPVGTFLTAVNAHNKTRGARFAITRSTYEALDHPKNPGIIPIQGFNESAYYTLYTPGACNSRALMTALPWKFPTISNPLGDNLSRWTTAISFLRQSVGR